LHLQTLIAYPIDYDILIVDTPPSTDLLLKAGIIYQLPLEIHDLFTLAANKMVVPHAFCLKSGLTF
jgi:cellulose biosynthesis protein BcsQ